MKMSPKLVFSALLLAVLLISVANFPQNFYIGDPYWMRAQAQAWLEGRDDIPAQYASQLEVGQYCFYNENSGKYYSKYGLFNSLFMLPVVAWWNFSGHAPLYGGDLGSTSFVFTLNCYNLLWTLGLAAALYWGASLFCQRREIAAAWTLICLFSSFGWNYLRAQSGEIFQWTMAAVFFAAAVSLLRAKAQRQKLSVYLWLGVWLALISLVMLKSIYILLVPIWLIVLLWPCQPTFVSGGPERTEQSEPVQAAEISWHSPWIIIPLICLAVLFLGANFWRFGSPFNSGYTQWSREADAFSGHILEGLVGFLFSKDKSIFLYQPLLIFSLLGIKKLGTRFPRESWLIGSTFIVFLLVNSKFVNWGGHWGYGPRYLLFVLSELSWPALLLMEDWVLNFSKLKSKIGLVLLSVVVALSTYMQIETNTLEFFTYYRVEALLRAYPVPQAQKMFNRRPFGLVNRDLIRLKEDGTYPEWLLEACREAPNDTIYLPQMVVKFCIYN